MSAQRKALFVVRHAVKLYSMNYLCLVLLIMIYFCGCHFQNSKKGFDVRNLSSDTLAAKKASREHYCLSKFELMKVDKNMDLLSEFDTLILSDMRMACDCPDWFDEIGYKLKYPGKTNEGSKNNELRNLEFRYYIQPACKELSTDNLNYVPNTKIKFIGKFYKKYGLPGNTQDPNPPKWKVFRYYSYEVIRPYRIYYTIHSFENTFDDVKDSMIYLTVN